MSRLSALVREPLLHFLGLGVAAFALYAAVAPPETEPAATAIAITAADQRALHDQLRDALGRPPTAAELDAAVEAQVADELLVRHGYELGLDRGDPLVRDRIRKNVEFYLANERPDPEPDDAALQAWLDGHPDRFTTQARLDIELLGFQRPQFERDRAEAARAALTAGADPRTLGGRSSKLRAAAIPRVEAIAGPEVAAAAATAALGEWQIVESPAQWTVLRVDKREAGGERPPLAAIRDQVLRDYVAAERRERVLRAVAALRERATVVRAPFDPAAAPPPPAEPPP